MLIILLWGLGIAFQLGNIVCSLLQLTHPYATRRWRVAWGWACLAHGLIIALRIRQALVMGFSPVLSAEPSSTWEQLMPLVVSGGLFCLTGILSPFSFRSGLGSCTIPLSLPLRTLTSLEPTMLILMLWGLALACQCGNLAFAVLQFTHPYGTRPWRIAWALAFLAHSLVIMRRTRLVVLVGLSTESDALLGDVWEQVFAVGISLALLGFNWMVARIFFAPRSRFMRPHVPADPTP